MTENQLKYLPQAIHYKMDHPEWSWEAAITRVQLSERVKEEFENTLKPDLEKYLGNVATTDLRDRISSMISNYINELKRHNLVEEDTFEKHVSINVVLNDKEGIVNINFYPLTEHGEKLLEEWNGFN